MTQDVGQGKNDSDPYQLRGAKTGPPRKVSGDHEAFDKHLHSVRATCMLPI
jgi:hypothetical protein